MFFDIVNSAIILTGIANFLLGIVIFQSGRKEHANRLYSLNIVFILLWMLGMLMYRAASEEFQGVATAFLYIVPIFIPSTFLHFTYLFPVREPISARKLIAVYGLSFALAMAVLVPGFVIQDIQSPVEGEKMIEWGMGYGLYVLYFVTVFSLAFLRLIFKLLRGTMLIKRQATYVLVGYAIAANLAMATNLILPGFGNFEYNWLGQIFTLVMVGSTMYAITQHGLFNVRLVATEIFVGLLSVVLFVNFFLAETQGEIFIRGSLFVAVLVLSYFLIRATINEIRHREELEEAYRRLQQLDKAKSEFISIASHQLRTPLTAIKGYISMVLEGTYGKLTEKQSEPIQSVYESNERLIRLVNDLLSISRIESGKIVIKKESASLKKVAASVLDELKLKAGEKRLYLKLEETEFGNQEIPVDAEKIRNVILNIVDNAIRYTSKGGITITLEDRPNRVRISIRDTGEGMSREELRSLFKTFSRGTAGLKLWTEGAGLGLYIAKQFVDMHNGTIKAVSGGKGKGSTFIIELPKDNHE